MKALLLLMIAAAIAAAGYVGWRLGRNSPDGTAPASGRKILYYQSAMHPWIKSDQPGNCTICGMKLTPVYDGEAGFATSESVVALSTSVVNVIHVETSKVERRPLERVLRVAGQIDDNPTTHRILSAYVDGRIDRIFNKFVGAEVSAGEPLALLYSPPLLTAEREYATLMRNRTAANGSPFSEEQARLIESARARLLRLGLLNEQIDQLAEKPITNSTTEIRAPISGTVVMQDAYEGQYVKEGARLFELADFSIMWFLFDVYERDLPWVRVGQQVEVRSPALGTNSVAGPVVFIDPNLKEDSRSARIRVELPNPILEQDGRRRRALFHKLYAEGRLSLATEPVLAVPRSAVLHPGDEPRVYIARSQGLYERRVVTLGRQGEGFIEIVSGLEVGDEVVTSGNLLIDSQAQINSTGHSHPPEAAPAASSEPVDPTHVAHSMAFLERVAEANAALASDDLPGYLGGIQKIQTAKAGFAQISAETASLAETIPGGEFATLDAARKAHLAFSAATAEFAKKLKSLPGGSSLKVFKCPMYPAPGKTAFWIQTNAPIRNPFYGSEMLDCGSEVK